MDIDATAPCTTTAAGYGGVAFPGDQRLDHTPAEMVVSAEATESILIPLSLEVRICHGVLGDV
jgi:hypothetical protein